MRGIDGQIFNSKPPKNSYCPFIYDNNITFFVFDDNKDVKIISNVFTNECVTINNKKRIKDKKTTEKTFSIIEKISQV